MAVTFTVPKSCDGTDWVLAKKVSKSDNGSYTGVSSYAYTKKNQTKTTVVFKNVKPGVYYPCRTCLCKRLCKKLYEMVENKENSCEISTAAICFTEISLLRKKIFPLLPSVYKAKLWGKDFGKNGVHFMTDKGI